MRRGQGVLHSDFPKQRELILYTLAPATLHEVGNPEDGRVLGRLIVPKSPCLEVIPVLVARTSFGRVGLEGEALAHLPGHRASVTERGCESAPAGQAGLESFGHLPVLEWGYEGVANPAGPEAGHELLDEWSVARFDELKKLLVGQIVDEARDGACGCTH